ncbi:MAG TPA: DUF5723 family protein [Longimicrobium sp.]|nr:DUF5723 family protein [Longimicrobium sp.]
MDRYRVSTLAALAALLAAPAAAQVPVPLTPRALGMGNGYVAAARGSESLWLNPANLGLPGTTHWSFTIPAVAAGADILGLGVGDVRDIIKYDDQSDARKEEILASIPETGTDVRAEVRVPLVSAQIRHFAVGVSYNTLGSHTLQKDFVDLLLFGFQPLQRGIPSIQPLQTQGFRASYVDVAAAYGRRIPLTGVVGALTAGATVHWYHGSGITRTGIVDVDTVRNGLGVPTDVQVTYAGVKDEGGGGLGLDLGAAYQPMPNLTFSASVTNLVNSFDFGGDRTLRTVTLTSADYNNGDIQGPIDRFDASKTAYNEATASAAVRALATDLGQEMELPRTMRVGAAYEPRPGTLLSAGYTDNLSTSRVAGMWDQSLGLGVQQRLAFLSARVGVASNFDSGTLLSGGLSLGPLHLGVARVTDGSVEGFDRSGWVATFGLGTASRTTMP